MSHLKSYLLFLLIYIGIFLAQFFSGAPADKLLIYYCIALVLYLISEGLKQLPVAKKQESGMVFLVLSTMRMFVFLIALLPLLLHRQELNMTKGATLGLLTPLLLTLAHEAFWTIKALKNN